MTDRPGFHGYRRPDGRIGTRNHVLVVPTVICSSVVAERVAAATQPLGTALPHLAGCGQLGPDMRVTHDTLAAYCGHPNVGAVVVIALGCEQVVAQTPGRGGADGTASPSRSSRSSPKAAPCARPRRAFAIARTFADALARAAARVVRCIRARSCRSSAADPTTRPASRRIRRSDA